MINDSSPRIYVFALFYFIISCSKENKTPVIPLPDNLYSYTTILDIGNQNDASDIRVETKVLSTLMPSEIAESRLVIVKSTKTIDIAQIKLLSTNTFYSIPVSNTTVQIYKLPSSLKDNDGDVIQNDVNYFCLIGVIGKNGSSQVVKSPDFTLGNKPIYAGDYVGTWEDLGPPGPATFPMSLRIANDYTGNMFYASANFKPFGKGISDAVVIMEVNGATIKSFKLNQLIKEYTPTSDCPAQAILTGNIYDDVNLKLNDVNWADCDGTRMVRLSFKRIK
ncbi:MAG: hypothetical protein ABI761_01130 [Saprospiraceae bacterium]